MKVLITGAYGQLGNEIAYLENDNPELSFIFTDIDILDITNEKDVSAFFEDKLPDFVVNCAAYTDVDKAESEFEKAKKINSDAPFYLANASKKINAGFIHISTDYVFDGKNNLPYNEDDPINPLGVYGLTKLNGEKYCLEAYSKSIIIRTSWLYSSYGRNFVKTMLRLGAERDEINVVSDQIGSPTYAHDLAVAILKIIKNYKLSSKNYIPGIFHYSNEGVCSWYDFAQEIFYLKQINCQVKAIRSEDYPVATKRPSYSVFDKTKIKKAYHIEIPHWKESLKDCLKRIE